MSLQPNEPTVLIPSLRPEEVRLQPWPLEEPNSEVVISKSRIFFFRESGVSGRIAVSES